MYSVIISSLLPIFLVLGVGRALRGCGFLPAEFFTQLNRLAFYVGLPALLFSRIATSPLEGGPALRILWVVLAATAVVTAVAFVLTSHLHLEDPGRGAFIQGAMRGNLAYIGLPVIIYSLTSDGLAGSGVETTAMLVLAPSVPVYNIVAVLLLTRFGRPDGKSGPPSVSALALAGRVLRNPLLIACLLGLLVAWTGLDMPVFLMRTLEPLSQMALPLALLAIGASLVRSKDQPVRDKWPTVIASLLKIGLAPALGYLFGRLFGLPPGELRMALIFLACPTAITSYVMAQQLGADEQLAGDVVVLTTVLSFFSLALVLTLV